MVYTPAIEDLALKLKTTADAQLEGSVGKVSEAWKRAWREVEREWQDALLDLANAADEGVWPTRSQIARSMKAQEALESTATALKQIANTALTVDDIASLTELARGQQYELLQAQMPPSYSMPDYMYDPGATNAIVNRTMKQITSLSWALSEEATEAMRSALVRGIAVGDNPRKAAADMLRRVGGEFEGGRARAENIARTEMMDALRDSSQQAQLKASSTLRSWRWVAGLSERTCPACLSMHGQEFPLDEPGPQGHPSCRCARAPVTKTWREMGYGVDEPKRPNAETGVEWFNKQPAIRQREILGTSRYEAWKAGKFPPEEWAVLKPNAAWRPSWVVGKPGA